MAELKSVLAEGSLPASCETGLFLKHAKTDPCRNNPSLMRETLCGAFKFCWKLPLLLLLLCSTLQPQGNFNCIWLLSAFLSMQPILFARPLFRLRSIPSFVPKCHRVFESSIGLSKPGASLQKQVQKSLALPNKQKSYQKAAEAGEILIYHCPIPRILAVQLSRLAAICLGVGSIVVAYASLKDAERPDFEPLYGMYGKSLGCDIC